MRAAGEFVMPTANHDPFVVDQNSPDHRVRARPAAAAFRDRQRTPHEERVWIAVYHFSSKSASTYSSGENGMRSSIASPTPT